MNGLVHVESAIDHCRKGMGQLLRGKSLAEECKGSTERASASDGPDKIVDGHAIVRSRRQTEGRFRRSLVRKKFGDDD